MSAIYKERIKNCKNLTGNMKRVNSFLKIKGLSDGINRLALFNLKVKSFPEILINFLLKEIIEFITNCQKLVFIFYRSYHHHCFS